MSTDRHQPRACHPWKRCTRCGIEAPDVAGEPPVCRNGARCELAKKLPRPQLALYPPHLVAELLVVDQRPWEELELGKVAA